MLNGRTRRFQIRSRWSSGGRWGWCPVLVGRVAPPLKLGDCQGGKGREQSALLLACLVAGKRGSNQFRVKAGFCLAQTCQRGWQFNQSTRRRLFQQADGANDGQSALNRRVAPGAGVHQNGVSMDFLRQTDCLQFARVHVRCGNNSRTCPCDFSAFATKIILHRVVIASKVKGQDTFFRNKDQPRFQIRAALKNIRGKFADAHAGMMMWLPKTSLHPQHGSQSISFHPRNALAETLGSFNRASHLTFR